MNPQNQDDSQLALMRFVLIIGFILLAYMLYNLTVSIYENYRIEQHIAEFQRTNEELKTENQEKLDDFQYFSSAEYIEKMAKQNLGLVNPGEKVIIIPSEDLVMESTDPEMEDLSEEIRASWSNPKKWWKFFFSYNPYKD
jgi:cell division protein FtsB